MEIKFFIYYEHSKLNIMKLNEKIYQLGLAKHAVQTGGCIKPLFFDLPKEDGVAIMNPSIANIDGELVVNLRCTNYTLWHSETSRYPHIYGPLQYIHPEHHRVLATVNYLALLDENLNIKFVNKVDTSKFDIEPQWDFIGLEDARVINWDDKLYLCGVRRDVHPDGQGRMELCQVDFNQGNPIEISRYRIPAPPDDTSYCEKNWAPVMDQPYTFVKWTNPTEIVKIDPKGNILDFKQSSYKPGLYETWGGIRGGTQVLHYKDKYIAIGHTVNMLQPTWGEKDAVYHAVLTIWDENFNIEYISDPFKFMNGKIEFHCGICEYGDYFLITFAYVDNASYIIKVKKEELLTE